MKKQVLLLLSFFVFITGCSKDDTEKDTSAPVINLTDPVNGQVFNPGDIIHIAGSIADDKHIAEVHIHVTNNNTGSLLMDVHLYPDAATTILNQFISAATGTNYKILVIAKDKNVNESTMSVQVSCN